MRFPHWCVFVGAVVVVVAVVVVFIGANPHSAATGMQLHNAIFATKIDRGSSFQLVQFVIETSE